MIEAPDTNGQKVVLPPGTSEVDLQVVKKLLYVNHNPGSVTKFSEDNYAAHHLTDTYTQVDERDFKGYTPRRIAEQAKDVTLGFKVGFRTQGKVVIEDRQIPLTSDVYDQTPVVFLADRFHIPALTGGWFSEVRDQQLEEDLQRRFETRYIGRFRRGGLIPFTEATPFLTAEGKLVSLKDLKR